MTGGDYSRPCQPDHHGRLLFLTIFTLEPEDAAQSCSSVIFWFSVPGEGDI